MPSHFGASYERIKRAADELNTRFYAPVAFCKTRWCASERRVFLNFKSNLLAIHRSDDDDPKAAYLDVRWVFTFVVMLDVLEHMSRASLLAQRVSLRPWQIWRSLCDYRDALIIVEAELGMLAEAADPQAELTADDFIIEALPTLKEVDFVGYSWMGLALWHPTKYTLKEVVSFAAGRAKTWIGALLRSFKTRLFGDIPEWLQMAEYTLGAKGLLDDGDLSILRYSYDRPVELGDGAFESHGATKDEVFGRLATWVGNYTGQHLDIEAVVGQYATLRQRVQADTASSSPQSLCMSSLWERIHSDRSFFEGVGDALWIAGHLSLRVSAESVVESMCSTLGSVSDRRHASADLRATTGIISWNKLQVADVEPLLQGALLRMPSSFSGFQRSGAQLFRNRKFKYSQVLDRILAADLRKEISAVPWTVIKRVPRSGESAYEHKLDSESLESESDSDSDSGSST